MGDAPVDWETDPTLEDLSLARLRESHNPDTGMFDRQMRGADWTPTSKGEAIYSTAICLIGLSRAGKMDQAGVDAARTFEALLEAIRRDRFHQALGLAVWAGAVLDAMPLDQIIQRAGAPRDGWLDLLKPRLTSEAAWGLSGLAHAVRRWGSRGESDLMVEALDLLLERRDAGTGLFRHASAAAPPRDRLRRHIGTFADQIYSIQALSMARIAASVDRGMSEAAQCAERVVALQGQLGQWWWHYAASKGQVAQAYPVYSVHQHGMGPMGLLAFSAAGGDEFPEAMRRSYAWLTRNELGESMIDREAGTIWRNVERAEGRIGRVRRKLRSIAGGLERLERDAPARLRLNRETWPYEWAWLLYAARIAVSPPPEGHLV
jgi:hypothetical protein